MVCLIPLYMYMLQMDGTVSMPFPQISQQALFQEALLQKALLECLWNSWSQLLQYWLEWVVRLKLQAHDYTPWTVHIDQNGHFLPVKYGSYPSKWRVLAKVLFQSAQLNQASFDLQIRFAMASQLLMSPPS